MTGIVKLAVNPLPWVFTSDGFDLSEASITRAMNDLRPLGYDALHADIPAGMTTNAYQVLLAEHGFRPAPGYFSAAFFERERHADIADAATRHAAAHAELGLSDSFIAVDLTPERMARPAQTTSFDPDQLAIIADGLAAAADAGSREGVTFALHPHIGSPLEREEEIRAVLDATSGSRLAFGPDTGHLLWGGSVPQDLIADYASRVTAIHLKDARPEGIEAARQSGADYFPATLTHRIWTEPGRGVVDFDAVFAALPADWDGWSVVEVDVPDAPTPAESARLAYDFLTRYSKAA